MAQCVLQLAQQKRLLPHANSKYIYQQLKLISAATSFGRHALIIMDGAGRHQQALADDFDNLTVLKLPPYSPELNPIEQVWQWLRQNVLANRCFSGYDECSIAWSSFIEKKERVSKLCLRQWAMLTS